MATYDITKGGNTAVQGTQPPAIVFLEGVVDFSKVNAGSGAAQNDVLQVINVPANTQILGVFWIVTTASTNAGTFNLGDGASATRWVTGAATNALADGNSVTNFFYTAADTIDVVQSAALTVTTGVLKIMVLAAHYTPSY
jgi:hypothetical protein